jgi:hypothetical protein
MVEFPDDLPGNDSFKRIWGLINNAETEDGFSTLSIDELKAALDTFATEKDIRFFAEHIKRSIPTVFFLNGTSVYELKMQIRNPADPKNLCYYLLKRHIENMEAPARGGENKMLSQLQMAAASPAMKGMILLTPSLRAALELSEGMSEIRALVQKTTDRKTDES